MDISILQIIYYGIFTKISDDIPVILKLYQPFDQVYLLGSDQTFQNI